MAGVNIRIVADGELDEKGNHVGGHNVEFIGPDGKTVLVSISGFATPGSAHDWVSEYMVKLFVAMRPVN